MVDKIFCKVYYIYATDTLLADIATFPLRSRSDNFRRILEGMKREDLRKLASNATDELKTCDDTKKR